MTNTSPRLLFSLDDISWDLGRGKLSFKLTKLPNSSWACVGPSLIQSFSCIFWGSVPLSYPILFPDYPGYTPPLYVAILAPTVHASAQEFPLHWFSLPLVIYGIGPAASQEDWQASLSSLLGGGSDVNPIGGTMWIFPRGPGSYSFKT